MFFTVGKPLRTLAANLKAKKTKTVKKLVAKRRRFRCRRISRRFKLQKIRALLRYGKQYWNKNDSGPYSSKLWEGTWIRSDRKWVNWKITHIFANVYSVVQESRYKFNFVAVGKCLRAFKWTFASRRHPYNMLCDENGVFRERIQGSHENHVWGKKK